MKGRERICKGRRKDMSRERKRYVKDEERVGKGRERICEGKRKDM